MSLSEFITVKKDNEKGNYSNNADYYWQVIKHIIGTLGIIFVFFGTSIVFVYLLIRLIIDEDIREIIEWIVDIIGNFVIGVDSAKGGLLDSLITYINTDTYYYYLDGGVEGNSLIQVIEITDNKDGNETEFRETRNKEIEDLLGREDNVLQAHYFLTYLLFLEISVALL